jgi:hypothetical protein
MDRTDVRNYLKAELQQRRIAEAKDRPVNFSLRPPPDFASQFNRLSDMQKSTMARLLGTTINDCRDPVMTHSPISAPALLRSMSKRALMRCGSSTKRMVCRCRMLRGLQKSLRQQSNRRQLLHQGQ